MEEKETMKERAYVLHVLIDSCIHRIDYADIKEKIPEKKDYVIYLNVSDVQKELIQKHQASMNSNETRNLPQVFEYFNFMLKVFAHPRLLRSEAHEHVDAAKKLKMTSTDTGFHNSDDGECNSSDRHDLLNGDLSVKLVILDQILNKCVEKREKMLVLVRVLSTLSLIEDYLREKKNWIVDKDYCRIDGQVDADKRMINIKSFNSKSSELKLFLLSSKAGGIGINLIAATRVVIFDPSWNPSNDTQSVSRVYRLDQTKPVFIYRFLTYGTIEPHVYKRQIKKISVSKLVIDEHHVDRQFLQQDLNELYKFEPWDNNKVKEKLYELLADLLRSHEQLIVKYHEHDSLLENKIDDGLSNEQKNLALENFISLGNDYLNNFVGSKIKHIKNTTL